MMRNKEKDPAANPSKLAFKKKDWGTIATISSASRMQSLSFEVNGSLAADFNQLRMLSPIFFFIS